MGNGGILFNAFKTGLGTSYVGAGGGISNGAVSAFESEDACSCR
jgi:hypothetical protein